ncbi:MAG: alpha-galactosidase [Acidobacteria bacterium]|nr:alpha-galactosidase [Acidobacteriota bacterium]
MRRPSWRIAFVVAAGAAGALVTHTAVAQTRLAAEAEDAYVAHDATAQTWTIGNRTVAFSVGFDRSQNLRTLGLSIAPDWANVLRDGSADALLTLGNTTSFLGATQSGFRYRGFDASATGRTVELTLSFDHRDTGVVAMRHYRTVAGTPVIEVWTTLTLPSGRAEVVASNLNAWRLSVPAGTVRWVAGLEPPDGIESFSIVDRNLRPGERLSFGSIERSSSSVVPVFSVAAGQARFFGGIMWSGAWTALIDRVQDRLDLTLSLLPTTRTRLRDAASVEAPHGFFGLVSTPDAISLALNAFIMDGLRGGRPLQSLVTYNTWFVSGSHLNEESTRSQMDHAARLGAEVFVVDAGWYPGGDRLAYQFTAGLGLYDEDSERFPSGLPALAEYAHGLGMKFGIWVEPERVDLATVGPPGRAQQNWLATHDGKYGSENTEYEVPSAQICLAHLDAQQWIVNRLSELIQRTGADYLKWDNNFWIDCNRGVHGHTEGDGRFAHVNGLYAVLRALRERFPDLIIENCSGGGNRLDLGMIQFTDVAWMDDRSAPAVHVRHNLQGLLQFFPAGYLFSFVMGGDEEPVHENPDLSLLFRSRMSGMLGLGFPGDELTEGEAEVASTEVSVYKELRSTLKDSVGILLSGQTKSSERPQWEVVEHRSPTVDDVVIFAYQNDPETHETTFRPVLLDPEQTYTVEILFLDSFGSFTGAELMRDGIVVPESSRSAAQIIVLRAQTTTRLRSQSVRRR